MVAPMRGPGLDLNRFRYVIAAAEHGSFHKASRALGVRQSVVSRCIADLEDQIGVALFIRSPSGVRLTYAGNRFLVRVRRAIHHIDHALQEVGTIGRGESGVVSIGIFSSLASGFLTDLIQTYAGNYPGVSLEFVEGDPAKHIQAVQNHQIDVAFVIDPPVTIECDTVYLWSERVFVVLSRHHRLAAREKIVWSDLRDQLFVITERVPGSIIHDYLLHHTPELGRPPLVKYHTVSRDTLLNIVAMGEAVTLISEATTGIAVSDIVYRPLVTDMLAYCAVWSASNDNPALRRFLSLARMRSRERSCLWPRVMFHSSESDPVA